MKKKFSVGPDGRINGLSVIGFHGEVDSAQTPARRGPIFSDEEGRLIGLESIEHTLVEKGAPALHEIWGRVGPRAESSLPGIATRLDFPIPARWNYIVVILGETEIRHTKDVIAGAAKLKTTRVNELLDWLGNLAVSPSPLLLGQRYESGVVWYCSLEEAFILYKLISKVAEQQMIDSSNRKSESELYQASWWLSRAALDDSDRYTAAVGLERSERRMSDAYLRATFRRKPLVEIEAGLMHARGVFDDRCTASLRNVQNSEMGGPQPGVVAVIGKTLAKSRFNVRERFIVRRRVA